MGADATTVGVTTGGTTGTADCVKDADGMGLTAGLRAIDALTCDSVLGTSSGRTIGVGAVLGGVPLTEIGGVGAATAPTPPMIVVCATTGRVEVLVSVFTIPALSSPFSTNVADCLSAICYCFPSFFINCYFFTSGVSLFIQCI